MALDDAIDRGQPQSRAFAHRLCGKEGVEDLRVHLGLHTDTGVRDTHQYIAAGFYVEVRGSSRINGHIFATTIPLYQCPSENPGFSSGDRSRSNYVACHSPDGSLLEKGITNFDKSGNEAHNPATKRALFNWDVTRSINEVTDGTSNTVAVSELISGPDGSNDLRGIWMTDLGIGYSHLRTPNSSIPDQVMSGRCHPSKSPCVDDAPHWTGWIVAARSLHPGGVNAAMADGSVRFFNNSIDASLWINLASIDGGEILPAE